MKDNAKVVNGSDVSSKEEVRRMKVKAAAEGGSKKQEIGRDLMWNVKNWQARGGDVTNHVTL